MRKCLFTFGALFLFSLALPALASAPDVDTKYTAAYVRANLAKGKTTLSEVKDRFGKPASARVENRLREVLVDPMSATRHGLHATNSCGVQRCSSSHRQGTSP
jgi:hypothetical protein